MGKKIALFCLLSCGMSLFADVMPSYQAPFIAGKQSVRHFPGVLKDQRIEYGNKTFHMLSPGKILILDGAHEIASLYPHFGTRHQKKFFTPDSPLFKLQQVSPLHYRGHLPVNDRNTLLEFQEEIRKNASGILEFCCAWETPAIDDLREGGLFFALPMNRIAGKKIQIGPRTLLVEDATRYGTFQTVGSPMEITCYAGESGREFSLTVTTPVRVVVQTLQGRSCIIRLYPYPQKRNRELKFQLDLTSGYEPDRGTQFAGVDFHGTDRLQVADFASRRNLLQNPSFESGLQFYSYFAGGAYMFPEFPLHLDPSFYFLDSGEACFGRYSLRMKAPPADSRPTLLLSAAVPFEKGAYTISFYARAEKKCRLLAQALFNKGANPWNSGSAVFMPTSEWKRYFFTVNSIQETGMCLALRAISADADSAHVWIDALQVEKGEKAGVFEPESVNGCLTGENVIDAGQRPNLSLAVSCGKTHRGNAEIHVIDWYDKTIARQNAAWPRGNGWPRQNRPEPAETTQPAGRHRFERPG